MTAKKFHLSRPDFLSVRRAGLLLPFPLFSAQLLKNTLGYNRFSIVTSARFSKKATLRNNFRRRLYPLLPTTGSSDIIIVPRPAMLNLTHDQITAALNPLVSKTS